MPGCLCSDLFLAPFGLRFTTPCRQHFHDKCIPYLILDSGSNSGLLFSLRHDGYLVPINLKGLTANCIGRRKEGKSEEQEEKGGEGEKEGHNYSLIFTIDP